MKKLLYIIISGLLLMSCSSSQPTREIKHIQVIEKLEPMPRLEEGWTKEKIKSLLGQPTKVRQRNGLSGHPDRTYYCYIEYFNQRSNNSFSEMQKEYDLKLGFSDNKLSDWEQTKNECYSM